MATSPTLAPRLRHAYPVQDRNGKAGEDEDSNANLFPKHVAEWCAANSDELSRLSCELEETKNAI